jgi:hypothetical protein
MLQRVVIGGIRIIYVFFLVAPFVAPYPKIDRTDLAAYLLLGVFVMAVALHVISVIQIGTWMSILGAATSVVFLFALLIRALSAVTGDSL